ncbi:membrane protein [Streptomyces spiroverticillatus]|uniref:Membrane protein n=1 Tax=Streptomyces finlayi TaxID=67296 RepID=A0A918X8T3_9ACTN|nr:FxsA family membrane protein [Streptomyces finlayi]GHA41985.1 membrane protein [Streptomyces spiroverticillatus]GHD17281.1 membrane protein [Streptomyces finlayi]
MTTGTPPPTMTPTPRKRSRARTFVPLGIAAWLVLEIWLLTLVAGWAGGLTVFLLLVGAVVLGGAVIKRAGRRAFKNLSETIQRQQQSGGAYDPAADEQGKKGSGNGFVMLGGLLLILPGLISDVLGLLVLVPPVRKALGRYAEKSLQKRMDAVQQPGSLGDMFQQARMHRPDGKVVQGEVVRDDATQPYPPRREDGPRTPLTP